ncbi:hypothetical protein BHE74_00043848 [Ensete ventricosum]|nr:hypothetical protein BHE74_00043848 [Ensete ventricosum]
MRTITLLTVGRSPSYWEKCGEEPRFDATRVVAVSRSVGVRPTCMHLPKVGGPMYRPDLPRGKASSTWRACVRPPSLAPPISPSQRVPVMRGKDVARTWPMNGRRHVPPTCCAPPPAPPPPPRWFPHMIREAKAASVVPTCGSHISEGSRRFVFFLFARLPNAVRVARGIKRFIRPRVGPPVPATVASKKTIRGLSIASVQESVSPSRSLLVRSGPG